MNNEIKEILDRIETASEIFDCLLEPQECTELLDYITNLQHQISLMEEDIRESKEINDELQQENERLEKEWKSKLDDVSMLTSRISKAIEYIKNENNITKHGIYPNYTYEADTKDLLNILQNGSDDE